MLLLAFLTLCGIACLSWRHVWSFPNSTRKISSEGARILSPADGSIVSVKETAPGEEVLTIGQGVKGTIHGICREAAITKQIHGRRKHSETGLFMPGSFQP